MKKNIYFLFACLLTVFFSCKNSTAPQDELKNKSWQQVSALAKGSTVTMMMYLGDKRANSYMNDFVIPELQKKYGVTLKIAGGQGNIIVSTLMAEKEAGKKEGQIDVCWINGETYYQIKQIDGLYGPYTNQLPNSKYINYNDPIIKYDFQEEINGFETPWGKAFFNVITDTAKIKQPPVTMQQFESYWKANPGRFTLSLDFVGLTLLKSWLVEIAGGIQELDGAFDAKKYDKYSTILWDFINKNKKYFWKKGETFPESNVAITQMYGTGELDFSFAFGISAVERNVTEGLFPVTSKAYILQAGCIHNTSYLGIPYNAPNKAGAMVVCDFLISPEAQVKKADIRSWGSATILDYDKLEKVYQDDFTALPKLKYGLNEAEVKNKSIKETASTYMIKVAEDFRKKVIELK
ncbi:MAG: ABC transporter substrate-binding protein [Ferruginibacter sp.]